MDWHQVQCRSASGWAGACPACPLPGCPPSRPARVSSRCWSPGSFCCSKYARAARGACAVPLCSQLKLLQSNFFFPFRLWQSPGALLPSHPSCPPAEAESPSLVSPSPPAPIQPSFFFSLPSFLRCSHPEDRLQTATSVTQRPSSNRS